MSSWLACKACLPLLSQSITMLVLRQCNTICPNSLIAQPTHGVGPSTHNSPLILPSSLKHSSMMDQAYLNNRNGTNLTTQIHLGYHTNCNWHLP
jgi:hypothetical protein